MASRSLTANVRKHVLRPRYLRSETVELRTDDDVRLSAAKLAGPADAALSIVLVHGFALSSRTPRIHAFARELARRTHVIVPDLRGHGASGGLCTMAVEEIRDVAAAVEAAPEHLPVVTVGISLGGAAVLLHAGAAGRGSPGGGRRPDGVVAISAPAWWGAWDTPSTMRIRRWATSPAGRAVMGRVLRTRVSEHCAGVPDSADVVARISPAFTLVVHDPADHYFGEEHAQTLYRWAADPRDLWLLPGTGHGTDLLGPDLAARIVDHSLARVGAQHPG